MSASDTIKTEVVEASDTVRSTEASVLGSIASHETLDADQPRESFKEELPMDETRMERDAERGEAEAETESAEGDEGEQPRPLAMVIAETTEEGDSGVPTVGSSVLTPGFHPDWLPANWLVEEHQRASGKRRDKYYYDPQSNRKFRSKREVEDYLNNVSPQTKMARTDAKSTPSSSSLTPKKRFSSRDDDCPTKIHWILNDDSGFSWKPMIGEQEISEHKRQSWESAFELACQGNNR